MKLVIYRNKETNKIENFHEWREGCTEEALKKYNENPKTTNYAEYVELEENSLAYYFYTLKTKSIKEEAEDLRDLEQRIRDIANDIDNRLYEFDHWFEEERNNER